MKTLKERLETNLHETVSMKIRNEATLIIVKHWLIENFCASPAEDFSKNSHTFHKIIKELQEE